MEQNQDVTELLQRLRNGDEAAHDQLYAAVYQQLRKVAQRQISGESPGMTWQATDLVHEWFVTIESSGGLQEIESRRHLLNTAAMAMRHLLIDHARARRRLRRGGQMNRIALDELVDAHDKRGLDLLALEEGLEALRSVSPKRFDIFCLEFFCGLSPSEIAETIGTGLSNVYVQLREGKAYLREFIPDTSDDGHN